MNERDHELRAIIDRLADSTFIQSASSYGEPGYTNPLGGILLADWNGVPQETKDILEQGGYALEWSEEWCQVDGKAYRTSPDSYFWEARVMYSHQDGDYMTPDYLFDWIHECRVDSLGQPIKILPSWFPLSAVHAEGYKLMEVDLENGLFKGMDDMPETSVKQHLANGAEYVLFQKSEQSQFYCKYKVFCKMSDCV